MREWLSINGVLISPYQIKKMYFDGMGDERKLHILFTECSGIAFKYDEASDISFVTDVAKWIEDGFKND